MQFDWKTVTKYNDGTLLHPSCNIRVMLQGAEGKKREIGLWRGLPEKLTTIVLRVVAP